MNDSLATKSEVEGECKAIVFIHFFVIFIAKAFLNENLRFDAKLQHNQESMLIRIARRDVVTYA